MQLLALEVLEQLGTLGGFRDIEGLMQQLLDIKILTVAAVVDKEQQILGIEDTHDVIDVLMVDRNPGITGFPGHFYCFIQLDGILEGDHLHAVGHHFGDHPVVELKDIVDHILFALLNGAFFLAHCHHHADFFLGDGIRFLVGVLAQQTQPQIGNAQGEPDNGPQQDGHDHHERGEQ